MCNSKWYGCTKDWKDKQKIKIKGYIAIAQYIQDQERDIDDIKSNNDD